MEIYGEKNMQTKRRRTRYNSSQIQRLERTFIKTHYPDTQQMERLSLKTLIPVEKMKIWFQNRRAKWRKNTKLKNFGGLGTVKPSDYVPAPNTKDISKPFPFYYYNLVHNLASSEVNAIDLRTVCLPNCEVRSQSMARMNDIYEKSSAYKKSGGITSIGANDRINPFEYRPTYYNQKETPAMASLALPSNPSVTSPLMAPIVRALHSNDEYESDVHNNHNYFNK